MNTLIVIITGMAVFLGFLIQKRYFPRWRILSIILLISILAVSCKEKSTSKTRADQGELEPTNALLTGQVEATLPAGSGEPAQASQTPDLGAGSPGVQLIAFTTLRDSTPYQVNQEIYLMDPDGSLQVNLTDHWAWDDAPAWSADGKRIAFWSDRDGNPEIYVMDGDGKNIQRLTNDPARDINPSWSPDGTRIAFTSDRNNRQEIFLMNADGSGQARLASANDPNRAYPMDDFPAWSPDGSRIAFLATNATQPLGAIHLINPDGSNEVTLQAASAFGRPAWSPDGKQIAFPGIKWSEDDPIPEIYIANIDGSLSTHLVAPGMDAFPSWSADGKSLVFESDRAAAMDYHHDLYRLSLQGALEQAEPGWLARLTTDQAGSPAWSPVGVAVDLAALASVPEIQPAPPRISTVCAAGCDFNSIQAAVDAVQPGETVEVRSGEYSEAIEINKPLTLRGMDSGAGLPVLQQTGEGILLTLTADQVVVEGFQLVHTIPYQDGPILVKSNHNAILGNTFKQCGPYCIQLENVNYNRIHQNTIGESGAPQVGPTPTIPGAIAKPAGPGQPAPGAQVGSEVQAPGVIVLSNSSYNQVTNNVGFTIAMVGGSQGDGGDVAGVTVFVPSQHNLVVGNTATILLDKIASENIVANNQADIRLNCGPFLNTIARNQVSQHSVGIQLTSGTPYNFIAFNKIAMNSTGIYLWRVNDVLIYANQVSNNTTHGIILSGAFPGDDLEAPGINDQDRPYSNVLYRNTLVDNPVNAYDGYRAAYWENLDLAEGMSEKFKNRWYSGSVGNYYSSYDEPAEGCQDSNGDLCCDTGYTIPGGESVDTYPFVKKPDQDF